MPKKSRPMPRGFVNNIILQSLMDGDKYGYEIIKEVEELTDGEIILKQPSLYSSLKRFETRGFISSYWGDSTIGGRRHYYSITAEGRSFFEEQVRSGEIKLKDIVYENVEDDVVAEQQKIDKQEDVVKPETSVEQDNVLISSENDVEKSGLSFEYINETTEKDEDNLTDTTAQNKAEIKAETVAGKKIVADVDDEDYNVFDLLESESAETNEEFEEDSNEEETVVEVDEQEAVVEAEEEEIEEEVFEEESYDADSFVETKNSADSSTGTTLAEQTKINLSELDVENSIVNSDEKDEIIEAVVLKSETEFIEPVNVNESDEDKASDDDEIRDYENDENMLDAEDDNEQQERAQTIVDEFGIMKSAQDVAPKRQRKHFDNVGVRKQFKDPVYRKKQVDNELSDSKLTSEKDISKTYSQSNFEETDRKISERIQKAVTQKFGKIESLDYKSLLGEVHFDEKEIEKQKLESDTIKLHDSYDENHFESIEIKEETSTIKNTPYTALEESLEKEGFKFKPYNIKFAPSKKRPEFLLSTKVGFYFGLAMFLIMIMQFGAFALYAFTSERTLSNLDKIFIYISFAVAALTLIATSIPYILNRKKRRYNSFKMSSTLIYALVVFISLSLLTYALNSFFGLTFNNVNNYLITLVLPTIVFSNLLIAPVVYGLLIMNKKFY